MKDLKINRAPFNVLVLLVFLFWLGMTIIPLGDGYFAQEKIVPSDDSLLIQYNQSAANLQVVHLN